MQEAIEKGEESYTQKFETEAIMEELQRQRLGSHGPSSVDLVGGEEEDGPKVVREVSPIKGGGGRGRGGGFSISERTKLKELDATLQRMQQVQKKIDA